MESFRPADWFNQLFGKEENPRSFKSEEKCIISCKKVGDNYVLTSKINNLSYNAGNFQVRYIPSFNDPIKCPVRNGGTFNIIIGNGRATKKEDFAKIDAFSMQSLPENDGATYLAASNFNCLEFVSSMQTAYSGVTNYVYDMTQGPYTALACPQSAVLRNYFIEFEDEEGEKRTGQLDGQINLLSKTPLRVDNGYVIINRGELAKLKSFDWSNEDNYAVGVHSNCDVLLKRGGANNEKFVNISKSQQNQRPAQERNNEDKIKESKKGVTRTQSHTPAQERNNEESKKGVSRTQSHTPAGVTHKIGFPYDDYDHKEDKESQKKTLTKSDTDKRRDGVAPLDKEDKEKAKNAPKPPETKHHEYKRKFHHHHSDDDDDDDSSSSSHSHEHSSTKKGHDSSASDEEKDNGDAAKNSTPRLNVANHVYAASFNFNGDVIENEFTLDIASKMLKAEYKATVLAAWENSVRMEKENRIGARKLYLTLLGGGVFGNPLNIIAEAIKSCKDIIVKSGLEVYVVCFDRYSYGGIKKVLDPLVTETKGNTISYK